MNYRISFFKKGTAYFCTHILHIGRTVEFYVAKCGIIGTLYLLYLFSYTDGLQHNHHSTNKVFTS